MLADTWQWTPFMVLIFLAGLRALPKDPFEAAAIDGANAFQIFWRLTVPMLGRVAAVAILIRGIDLFRIYDYVSVMTGGGRGIAGRRRAGISGSCVECGTRSEERRVGKECVSQCSSRGGPGN